MSGTGYKALGFIVFKAAKAYLRYRYPAGRSRKLLTGALVVAGAVAVAVAQHRHGDDAG